MLTNWHSEERLQDVIRLAEQKLLLQPHAVYSDWHCHKICCSNCYILQCAVTCRCCFRCYKPLQRHHTAIKWRWTVSLWLSRRTCFLSARRRRLVELVVLVLDGHQRGWKRCWRFQLLLTYRAWFDLFYTTRTFCGRWFSSWQLFGLTEHCYIVFCVC